MEHPERFSFGWHPGDRQEGRPDVRPARPRGPRAGRPRRDRHAARRAVPRRRRRRRSAQGIIEDDRLEAVIGLAPEPVLRHRHPGLHPGAARHRPASGRAPRQGPVHQRRPRVHRGPRAELPRPAARREDRHRLPRATATSPASPASSDIGELADNDFNLNIRRYVDNTPPPEPQDVRAHLHGGVPEARSPPMRRRSPPTASTCDLSCAPNETRGYHDFPPAGWQQAADEIPALAAPKEAELHEAFDDWWDRHVKHIIELPDTGRPGHGHPPRPARLVRHRAGAARRPRPLPAGRRDRLLVGRRPVRHQDALAYRKFSGVVQGWLTTIEAAFEPTTRTTTRDKQTRSPPRNARPASTASSRS